MNITATLANHLFLALNRSGNKTLHEACDDPKRVQQDVLFSILRRNVSSEFGRQHGFRDIQTIAEFQARVPLSHYDEYLPFISRMMKGEQHLLTADEIHYFALSSGSAAASKYIPYTKSLKQEFSRTINPWIFDLLKNHRKLRYGTQFWIITPATLPDNLPESKIPIGFEEDQNYFGKIGRYLIRSVMNLPQAIGRIQDNENYFYLLSYCLLKDKDLRLISVWNPGLLIIILKYIAGYYEQLCHNLIERKIQLPNPGNRNDVFIAKSCTSISAQRARYLAGLKAFDPSTFRKIWPHLSLISCWTDGWAGDLIPDLQRLLPGVDIQGKGLMATEGVVSLPVGTLPHPLLSLQSQFYEFKSLSDSKIYLAHELKENQQYEVFLTSSGGFYRYAIEDIIEVKGFFRNTPLIRFISKHSMISDLCGEKLHEAFVSGILQRMTTRYLTKKTYLYLAPARENDIFFYLLIVEDEDPSNLPDTQFLMEALDSELMQNFHYKHCRQMHQLGEPKLHILSNEEARADQKRRFGSSLSSTKKFSYLETKHIHPYP